MSLLVLFVSPVVVFVILYLSLCYFVSGRKSVCIVVLGDIGRSPRMQYHSLSFAREGYQVDLVGYKGSIPHKDILDNECIQLHYLPATPGFVSKLPRLLAYVLKASWQSVVLGVCLLLIPKTSHIFIQNPPAVPTLAVAWVTCIMKSSTLVVDWHNYAYSILAMPLSNNHPLVKASHWYERFFGRRSMENICVTKSMKEDLAKNWGISADTLYDRPPSMFKETPLEEKHKLFMRLSQDYTVFGNSDFEETVFTVKSSSGSITNQPTRPALVISSTSWTEDEDFGILLDALKEYEKAATENPKRLPDVVCIITGKGPQKDDYSQLISEMEFSHVQICLPWLTAEDYPLLLGSADLGVCLHRSSSGLDLPMKVVDMFGCGLPVCAINFKSLPELVKHNENGLIFKDSEELSQQLQDLLTGFPAMQNELSRMRQNLKSFQSLRWHESWTKTMLPIFNRV